MNAAAREAKCMEKANALTDKKAEKKAQKKCKSSTKATLNYHKGEFKACPKRRNCADAATVKAYLAKKENLMDLLYKDSYV